MQLQYIFSVLSFLSKEFILFDLKKLIFLFWFKDEFKSVDLELNFIDGVQSLFFDIFSFEGFSIFCSNNFIDCLSICLSFDCLSS